MKRILGITAEYDPFHSGHAYQLEKAKEAVCPQAVVCAMSGDFTQRGEPAVLDKWTRSKIAVQQGVDLVLELPFMYACSRAERFASGAVDILVSAGATHISFGCESERPEDLKLLADGQLAQAENIQESVGELMKEGYSRVKATELVSRKLFGDELTELMLTPNNILALEYLKRIRWWQINYGIRINPVPVVRRGSGYRDADPSEGFAGGSAIRQILANGEDVAAYLPYDPSEHIWADLSAARQRMYDLLRGILLRNSPESLRQIYCVGEGMEHRLLKEARCREHYEEFLSSMISRRYTAAAIRRIMLYILMNIDEMPACDPYGRVLAAGGSGRKLLRVLDDRKKTDDGHDPEHEQKACHDRGSEHVPPLTVIANTNRKGGVAESVQRALALDCRAADLYNLINRHPVDEMADTRQRPYIGN